MLYVGAVLFFAFIGLLYVIRKDILERATVIEKDKENEETLEALKAAHLARLQLVTDPEFRQLMQDKYTRK